MTWKLQSVVPTLVFILASQFGQAVPGDLSTILVDKQRSHSMDDSVPQYFPIDETIILASGFSSIADYDSFGLFDGPTASAVSLIEALKSAGYAGRIATDLDTIDLLNHSINADTGEASPKYSPGPGADETGSRGLYLIAMRGYPVQLWIDDLLSRGVSIIEPLPPAGYLVEGPRDVLQKLKVSTTYVRGVFPFLSQMKTEPLIGRSSDAVFQTVAIDSFELSADQRLEPFLQSVADRDSVAEINRVGPRVLYAAALAPVDIETLSAFTSVFAITPVTDAEPSSERQGMLVAAPNISPTGVISIPAGVAWGGYSNYLSVYKGISNFSNTRIAIVDTGFDNNNATLHPGLSRSLLNFVE